MPLARLSFENKQPTRGLDVTLLSFQRPSRLGGNKKASNSRQRPSGRNHTGRIRSLEGAPVRRVTSFLAPPSRATGEW
jgi:hypothetical protein